MDTRTQFPSDSGLRLGQTSAQVRAILGKPSFSSDDKIVYFFSVERKTAAEDFETLKKQNPQMTEDELHQNYDFYTLGAYFQARFLSDKLVYLCVSKTESY
jgi:hypothetical protein